MLGLLVKEIFVENTSQKQLFSNSLRFTSFSQRKRTRKLSFYFIDYEHEKLKDLVRIFQKIAVD